MMAHRFKARHRREPTFWLDKVCIDQDNIADGLKVLSINVMACRKMLVLCGPTYAKRLWCVIELFTIFAFAGEKVALERIEIIPLGDGDWG